MTGKTLSADDERMLHNDTVTFLIRCATWALLGWIVWSQPIVRTRAREYRAAWIDAWRVDHGECDVRAYGLLFKSTCDVD